MISGLRRTAKRWTLTERQIAYSCYFCRSAILRPIITSLSGPEHRTNIDVISTESSLILLRKNKYTALFDYRPPFPGHFSAGPSALHFVTLAVRLISPELRIPTAIYNRISLASWCLFSACFYLWRLHTSHLRRTKAESPLTGLCKVECCYSDLMVRPTLHNEPGTLTRKLILLSDEQPSSSKSVM